jgi:hypothetical protein
MSAAPVTAAERAVMHLVHRLKQDPRLAYLIGHGSESFELLVTAAAALVGDEPDTFREGLVSQLTAQPVPGIGQAAGVIEHDVWSEILEVNSDALDVDQQLSIDYLVNHFVRLGLNAYKAQRDAHTEELF